MRKCSEYCMQFREDLKAFGGIMEKSIRICLLISIWSSEYLKLVLDGIKSRIANSNIKVDVFVGFDIDEWNGISIEKEREFFSLVETEAYDGALVAIGGVNYLDAILAATKKFTDKNMPVISIESPVPNASMVRSDNYDAFFHIVEHMLRDHGCETISYIGGHEAAPDAKIRYQAFMDCCEKYRIPEENIFARHYSYMFEDGKIAYEDFKKVGRHLPDVVICANDSMARGYCEAALADGYRAPKDYLITGFDNDSLSHNYIPSMTTVDANVGDSAYTAMDLLIKKLGGQDIPELTITKERVVRAQSCGCVSIDSYAEEKILALHKAQEWFDNRNLSNRLALQYISSCASIEDLQKQLDAYCGFLRCEHVGIALNSSILNGKFDAKYEGYDDEMVMVTRTGIFNLNRHEDLYPQYIKERKGNEVFVVAPIYYESSTLGYVCYSMNEKMFSIMERRSVSGYLGVAIESLRQNIALKCMNDEIEKINRQLKVLSVTDSLTGLYNRLGYAQLGENFYNENNGEVYFLYIDMDRLKYINDNEGHDAGNVALVGIAKGIQTIFPKEDLQIRMGGDEFLVIGRFENEFEIQSKMKKLEEFLSEYGKDNNLPIELTASMGYVIGNSEEEGIPFEEMVKAADAKMYEVKMAKKRS